MPGVELESLLAGVSDLSRRVQEVKDFVDEKIEGLSRKQDDLADNQEEMKDQLGDVQNNIQGVRFADLASSSLHSAPPNTPATKRLLLIMS